MASKEDQKILEEALDRYQESVDESSEERNRMADELRFSAGEQWPEKIKQQRENDPNGARPCLTMDKLGQYRRQVVNDARQNKPSIKVRPVDSGADVEVADILQGLIRNIEDVSCSDIAYDAALDSAANVGLGWFRIRTKVTNAETNQQDIQVDPIENIFSVYPDSCWKRPDGSDMEWCFITDDVPRKRFESEYPKADVKGWEADDKTAHWVTKETVKVAEYFRIKRTSTNILELDTGEEIEESKYWEMFDGDEMRPQVVGSYFDQKSVVEWFKLTSGEILDRTVIPSEWIPVIPVVGNVAWVDGKRVLTGMTYWGTDAQRAYNYARSAFIEQVALAPKAPFIAAAGQIEGFEKEWREANRSNQPVLRYNSEDINGHLVPPPQRQMPPQPSAGWLQEMQVSERDIQSALGMYAASVGNEGQEKSGRAILARQKEGDTSTFHYIDNLSRSIRHAGRIIIGMIPKVMDTRRMVRILGEDGAIGQAVLDPSLQQPYRKVQGMDGKFRKLFNPNLGKYDVSVSVGPAYNTRRMEAADTMMQFSQGNPQIFPLIGDLMVKAMDWPMSDEIAERLKAVAPPQIQAILKDDEDEGGVNPQVMQVQQQAEQIIGQLQEQMQQMQMALQQSAQEVEQAKAEAIRANMRAEQAKLQAQETQVNAASEILQKDVQIARAELQAEESDAVVRVTQMAQGNKEMEEPEPEEPQPPAFDPMAMMQMMAAMQPTINLTVPVTVDGKGQTVKQGRAVKQPDGTWSMEAIETPTGGMQ